MIFCCSPSASVGAAVASGGEASGTSATGAAVTGGVTGATGAAMGPAGDSGRMREMGGRNGFLAAASPSARFARGFFSSISDTVSIGGFLGLGASASGTGSAGCVRALMGFNAETWRGALAGVSTLALFVSLPFASGAALTGASSLTGLRAVTGLRAAVLVVVFVGIGVPENNLGQGRSARKPVYCAAGVS